MLFNTDPSKTTQEVLLSRKTKLHICLTISLNNIQLLKVSYQKHLGILPEKKLDFKLHVDYAVMNVNNGIFLIKKLRHGLPWKSIIAIYKAFLQPLINYGDIMYDQPQNKSFCEKLEFVQYKAALAITRAIQGRIHEKIYQKLGLESLKSRR